MYALSTKVGAHSLMSSSEAISTSRSNPRSINSRPDPHCLSACPRSDLMLRYAASAAFASGARPLSRWLMIAPAQTQSSKAGRSEPSSHRSPAGITATRRPYFAAASAIARQFLKHPVRVGVAPVARLNVEPLGEGSANRVPARILINDAGESEYLPSSCRTPANSALTEAAKAVADSSFQR